MGARLTTDQLSAVEEIFKTAGVPTHVWYPIMMEESGGSPVAWNNPKQNGGTEDSRGLFQINLDVHKQWEKVNLFDPVQNATIAAYSFIKPAYEKAVKAGITDPALQAEYVWKNGIKPKWSSVEASGKDKSLKSLASKLADGLAVPTATGPASSYDPTKEAEEMTGGSSGGTSGGGGGSAGGFEFGLGNVMGVSLDRVFGNILWLIIGVLIIGVGLFIAFNPGANFAGKVMENVSK